MARRWTVEASGEEKFAGLEIAHVMDGVEGD